MGVVLILYTNYEYREISYKYIIIIDYDSVKSDNMQSTIL